MISWRALLDAAQPLTVAQVNEEFIDRAVVGLRKVKLPLRGAAGFRYPATVDALSSIRATLEDMAEASPMEAVLLASLLRRPLRAYPLISSESAIAVVGSWRVEDQIEARIAVIGADPAGLTLDTAAYAVRQTDADLLPAMEQLYLDMAGEYQQAADPTRGANDRVLWIGGSSVEANDPRWRARVEAVLMTEGFETLIRERPGMDSVATGRAVSETSAAAVIVWVPRLGSPNLLDDLSERVQARLIQLNEYVFNDVLEELRLLLEEEPLAPGDPADESPDASEFEAGGPYYFKKIAKRGRGVDLMVHRREPCSHDSWTVVHGAPQARKGIERHTGRTISKLEHCDRCTGGGMWRVTLD